jgi:hypothetical protein
MKRIISAAVCLLLLYTCAPQLSRAADDPEKAAFEKMRTLIGTWQGNDDDGRPATVKYETMSGGSIVVETLSPDAHPSMLTVYHMDGDKVLCTHYCSRNNQPRMKLKKYDPKTGTLEFDFLDATNLSSPDDGHMHSLTLKLTDKDHLEQDWSWKEGGQNSLAVFKFQRKS